MKGGQPFGRPPLGDPSKYLLTGLAVCGLCGGTLKVVGWKSGQARTFAYACSAHYDRGPSVCTNRRKIQMDTANSVVLEILLDHLLDDGVLSAAVDQALSAMESDASDAEMKRITQALAKADLECARLSEAIAAGGHLSGLLDALRSREATRAELRAQQQALRAAAARQTMDSRRLLDTLTTMAHSWRDVLLTGQAEARPIVAWLLKRRVVFRPLAEDHRWEIEVEGTLSGLFSGELSHGRWRPHREEYGNVTHRMAFSV